MHVGSSTALTDLTWSLNPTAGTNTYSLTDGSGTYTLSNPAAGQLLIGALVSGGSTNFTVTATSGSIALANNAIQAGAGNVSVTASTGSITRQQSCGPGRYHRSEHQDHRQRHAAGAAGLDRRAAVTATSISMSRVRPS